MPASLIEPIVFERGDHIYAVAPVAPISPDKGEISEYAFAEELRKMAPNPNLTWMRGQYVEADAPNLNRQAWTAGELAIKSLTPVFCPVTVMHDPRTAVGVIADTRLLTPENADVPRSRIDTTLALWGHRFPEVLEEAMENYKAGTLMQSMECVPLDTEILTRRGWKRYDELREHDETIGYNPATGRNEWTAITAITRKRGELFSMGTGKWRAICTAAHGWLASYGRRVGSKYVYEGAERVEARDLNHRHQLVLSALADLDDPEGHLPITPAEAAVVAWIAGDGSVRSHRGAKDFQATIGQAKPDGIMALEMALADAGIDYTVTEQGVPDPIEYEGQTITARLPLKNYYLPAAQAKDIWLRAELDHLSWTQFVMRLSGECRAAFMEAIYQAEGNENHGSRCIAQMPGPLKDAIALGGYLEGYRPVSHHHDGDNSQANSHVRLARAAVNGTHLRMLSIGEADVWCPTTGLGSWTMRQGDQILLTGNCLAPSFECSVCGMGYHKMPGGFERENFCAHLRDMESSNASRILRDVTFTGTGLIFGTRDAEGANPNAHLEVFQEEVAEAHLRWHAETTGSKNRHMATITVEQSEWERVQRERDEAVKASEAAEAAKTDAEAAAEAAEAAKAKAESERDSEKSAREAAEEQARASALRDERLSKLGDGFKAKLGDKTKARLTEQAAKLSDEEWDARLDELAEAYGITADAEAKDGEAEETFSGDEIASAKFGSGTPESADEPTLAARRAVMGGLFRK